jgi:hypothetical protein
MKVILSGATIVHEGGIVECLDEAMAKAKRVSNELP